MDELLSRCLRGDQDAWCEFVDRYDRVIYAAVRRALERGGAVERAPDIAQDVFVRLVRDDFRLLRLFDPAKASLATYLTVIAVSTTRDTLRRRQLTTTPLDPQRDLTAVADQRDSDIEIPLELLSPRQQLVLTLLFDRQLHVSQIAQILGITTQSVRSTKHKAISRLRKYFYDQDKA